MMIAVTVIVPGVDIVEYTLAGVVAAVDLPPTNDDGLFDN